MYLDFSYVKQLRNYHACFLNIQTNITHEKGDKLTHFVLVGDNGGFSYHPMSKLFQNISETNMVTPHLFRMDEIHALQKLFPLIFKKIPLFCFCIFFIFWCEPP